MWFGLFLLALAAMLAICGGRTIRRDFAERRWGWGSLGIAATFGGTVALIILTFIVGSVVGGP